MLSLELILVKAFNDLLFYSAIESNGKFLMARSFITNVILQPLGNINAVPILHQYIIL